jgi:hypothetical protein
VTDDQIVAQLAVLGASAMGVATQIRPTLKGHKVEGAAKLITYPISTNYCFW